MSSKSRKPGSFHQEGGQVYYRVGSRLFRVLRIEGVPLLLPTALERKQELLSKVVSALTKQVQLYKQLLEAGVPIEDAVACLPRGSLLTLEYSERSLEEILAEEPFELPEEGTERHE